MIDILPDSPSQLIRVALADLRKCEADPRYVINMAQWHAYDDDLKRCYVCMAGAVMSKSLGAPPDMDRKPSDYFYGERQNTLGNTLEIKLEALDYFRTGDAATGLVLMGYGDVQGFNREIPIHLKDREGFHTAMQKLADDLEAAGY